MQGERGAATVQAMAWAAQIRLCARYRHLYHAGKAKCVVTTAVARELVGFIWAIACEVTVAAYARDDLLEKHRPDCIAG